MIMEPNSEANTPMTARMSIYESLGDRVESLADFGGAFLYTLKDGSWIMISPIFGEWVFGSSRNEAQGNCRGGTPWTNI